MLRVGRDNKDPKPTNLKGDVYQGSIKALLRLLFFEVLTPRVLRVGRDNKDPTVKS